MKRTFKLDVTKGATYDRVFVGGRIVPMNAIASVAPGDTIAATIEADFDISGDVVWLEQDESPTSDMIISHHARELAGRRGAPSA